MIHFRAVAAASAVALFLAGVPAAAKNATASIVIRAGKTGSASHTLARQLAAAVAVAVNGAYTLDVKESQGSVQNVIASLAAPRDYVFTAAPDVIAAAERGAKPFKRDGRYRRIRALVPMPALTVQWVVSAASGVTALSGLAGHPFIAGPRGSVGERVTEAALQALGIEPSVQLLGIDPVAAPAALKAKQVEGFALAGAYPVPALVDLARALPIRLLGLPQPALGEMLAADDSLAAEVVPKGSYPGQDADVTTVAVPGGLYTTLRMPEKTAYAITKAFWSRRDKMIARNPQWQAVTFATLATLKVRLHRGALRYYREAGVKLPRALR